MFYKVDSTRVSAREYWWECRAPWMWPVFLIGLLLKLLHVRIPSSTDDLTVDELRAHQVRESELEPELLSKFVPREGTLGDLGFHSPVYHAANDAFQRTAYRVSTLQHDSGRVVAQIRFRLWSRVKPAKESLFVSFITPFTDGTYLITTSAKKDMLPPPECDVTNLRGADVEDLWSAHEKALGEKSQLKHVRLVEGRANLLATIETLHRLYRDFHVRRGVFVPLTPAEATKAAEQPAITSKLGDVDDAAFLKELAAQQAGGKGFLRGALILAASLILFISLGSFAWSWTVALALVPILFFHELGHFVAMRAFGYQNLKMFFIPLFGAAVTGRSYNVAGWKKAVVSLMGPVPGIFLAVVLGIVGMVIGQKFLLAAAVMMLVLNGLNLLPLLPLDGGWVAHTLIFSRHAVLDVAFRLATVLLLFGLMALTQDRMWMYLAIATAVTIPWSYRIATIAKKIRGKGIQAVSADGKTIDPAAAVRIFHEIRVASPTGIKPKQGAQLTMQIFDWLNTRPPGILATLALGMVHIGSFITALVFGAVFVVAMSGDVRDFILAAASAPTVPLNVAEIQHVDGPNAAAEVKTLVGECESPEEARTCFTQLKANLPATASATLIGQHVLISIPKGDNPLRERLLTELEQTCKRAFVSQRAGVPWVRIMCIAPNEQVAEKLERECADYFNTPNDAYLIPPWSPKASEMTAEDHKGRRTLRLLQEEAPFVDDPAYAELTKQLARAARRGDSDATKAAQDEMQQLLAKRHKEHVERVKQEHGDELRKEVVDLFASRPADPSADEDLELDKPEEALDKAYEKYQKELQAWSTRIGSHMGQLPLEDGKPAPQVRQFSTVSGHCSRVGLLLTFEFISFERVDRGVPALVSWLSQQGCNGFKYSIDAGFLGGNLDDASGLE